MPLSGTTDSTISFTTDRTVMSALGLSVPLCLRGKFDTSMQHIIEWALNIAEQRGASFADARIVDDRSRSLATKNGKIGHASDAESQGIGIRVIADGAWGFAASKDLTRRGVESAAARALAIARASAKVKRENVRLAPEKPAVADWATPCK